MSEKQYCENQGMKRKKLIKRVFSACVVLVILVLFVILLIWLILRPTKPQFTLQDLTVYQFDVNSPNFLTSNIQVTVQSRNPNDRIGIYYDRLDIYATYRDQQITFPTLLLQSDQSYIYQGHKGINVFSSLVYGSSVPIAPYIADSLNQDQSSGYILIHVKVYGKLRWKVGTWVSGHYRIYVNCPAYIRCGNPSVPFSGFTANDAGVKFQLFQPCVTEI